MSHPQNLNVPDPEIGTDSLLPHRSISNVPFAQVGLGQYPPQSAPNQAHPVVSDFANGSGHIFSMYLEMATEEDKKMVEDWKADADGILIFVRLSSGIVLLLHAHAMAIDWSILRCCRNVDICIDSGYPTEPTRYFQLLPGEHLSDAC